MNGRSVTRSGAFVASLLMMLVVRVLAVVACGGETTSSTSPSAASPNPAASHGEANPSATASAGPRMAVSYAQPPGLPSPHAITVGTVGWKFKPTVDIKVTQLGCFDVYQDGLALSHRVGIFDGHTGRLMASVTVHPKSTLDGAFRWESLRAPLVLKAG
jgi:hypothetical protein